MGQGIETARSMRGKIIARSAVTLAGCLGAVGGWAVPAPAQVSGAQALANLNAWRAELGLPAVAGLDPAMSEACRRHNRYMALNPFLAPTHDELPGASGFSRAGLTAGGTSVLAPATEAATPRELWEFAVFHRIALLDPRLRTTWWALNDGWACMGTEGARTGEGLPLASPLAAPRTLRPAATAPTTVGYPSPAGGATAVPTSFSDLELPDPRDLVPGRPARIGWPLSVSLDGPWDFEPALTLTAATLATAAGEAVAVTALARWHSAVIMLPHAALQPATDYVARVAGSATHGSQSDRFDVTWRFRTADDPPLGAGAELPATGGARRLAVGLHTRLSRGRLAVRLTVPPIAAGRRATLSLRRPSGRWIAMRKLVLAPTTRAILKVPARGPLTLRVTVPRFAGPYDVWGEARLSRVVRR